MFKLCGCGGKVVPRRTVLESHQNGFDYEGMIMTVTAGSVCVRTV
jgi:hypothetical protein